MKSFTESKTNEEFICPKFHTRYCYNECNWFGNCPDQERGEALPETKAICPLCGRVGLKIDMHPMQTGRNTQLLCLKCYCKGMKITGQRIGRKMKGIKLC